MEQNCPRCGTRNASSTRFWKVDGSALSQEARPAQTVARVCPTCGTANSPHGEVLQSPDCVPLEATIASGAPLRIGRAIGPSELKININRALSGGRIDGVTAQVGVDGAVTLRGQTDRLAETERAFRVARTGRGVCAAKDLV
ncbi:MAG TPA: hypothetical protein VNE58_10790 [Casimicrobiaceae bacterium]|nr:hypothetical protein [Casimicrobiaceae bacterium]